MKMLVSVLCVLVAAGGSAAGRVLSVNIAYGDADKMSVQDGLDNSLAGDNIPCSSWHDVSAVSGSVTGLPVWTGTNVETVATLALSWDVKEIWGTGSSPCVFRRGWIAATSKGEWTMTFSNVPFASYDVICYCNWDGGHGFEPIQVNGQKWTQGGSDAVVGTAYWGTVTTDLNDSAKFGQNAIRVAGQSGSTLEIGSRGYGNVCAVQIVEKSAGGEDPPVVDPPAVDPNAPALPDGLVMTKYDRNGRSWWLHLDPSRAANVTQWQVTYPNPDDESGITNETATLAHSTSFPNATFRRRFPAGEGPWTVTVSVTMSGTVYAGSLTVRRPTETVAPPVRNGEILVGVVAYESQVGSDGSASFLQNSADLLYDVLENDLCNFCISWYGIEMLMPQSWPSSRREIWKRRIEDSSFSAMSIYSGDYRSTQARAMRAFDGRYWGNNVGELASFLYQGVREMQANLNLQQARDTFVNGFVGNKVVLGTREGGYDFDMTFSTCGAALSCYELAGGIDFICSELWAIGAANIGYASAEARGAARKWGPEYWGGWNAHDWQTRNIPYHTDQKFNSMLASYFQEYIAGTSMIILESGTQGPQAWQYAEMYPGQPYAERAPEGYDGEVATRYRRMVKRFYEWTKTHPRGDATPESKIALALGNLDGYLGENGGYAVWAQHDNTGNANWRYGAPENTQALVQDIFYPRPESLTAPYKNSWIGGTPYGQADVMQIDDDVALADLSRYALLVFGGWNTMTPHVKDVLERYVEQGGTLVMSRPELTTRVDREYTNYADGDLRPLFGELPAEGDADDFVETVHGKGRYILFTARAFPGASDDGKAAYAAKVRELAAAVRQSATISAATAADRDAICYGVYPEAVYFLNADTVAGHAFTCVLDGEEKSMSLEPLQVAVVDRKTGEIELTLNSWNDAGASDPKPPQEPEPETLSGTRDYDLALESGTRFVAGWNSAVSWDEHRLAASNGTLLVSGTVSTHGYTVDVEDGCRMVFQIGSTLEAASMSGSPFRQVVHDGGELTLNGDMRLYNYRLTVESGGRATVSPTWVETINTTAQGSVFENAGGTMSVPRGLSVSTAASGAGGRVTLRQTSGTLELGGKLVQTAGVEPFALDLAGGLVRIVAPAEVALAMVSVAYGVTFAVDLDRFKSGGVFFTSANDELVAKVKGDIAAQLTGTGYLLTEDNGVLTLVAGTPPEDPPEDPDDPEGPPESPPSDDPGGVVTEVTSLKVDSAGRLRIGVKVKMTDDLENPDWQYVTIENPKVSDDGKTLIVPVPASGARGFYKLVAEDPSK